MNHKPWYRDGLKFKCLACGDCCTGDEGYVWINKEEIAAMAALMGESDVEKFEDLYVRKIGIRKSLKEFASGDCYLYDVETRSCKVYKARPRQCQSWPFWNSNVKTPEKWEEAAEICPGCNKGNLHRLEEIEQRAAMIRV